MPLYEQQRVTVFSEIRQIDADDAEEAAAAFAILDRTDFDRWYVPEDETPTSIIGEVYTVGESHRGA